MIREFFYLQKSDRRVILTLLAVMVVALGIIFLTGGERDGETASGDSFDDEQNYHQKLFHHHVLHLSER